MLQQNKGTPRFTQDSEKIHTIVNDKESGSVAVLFFKNLSKDEDQEYFCEGFSEDLLSMLSRFNKLVAYLKSPSFAYKDKNKSFKDIGNDLGVRYNTRKRSKTWIKMRINANLVSTENEGRIWSKNFDLSVDEVFDVQDKIADEIVTTIVGRVEADHLNSLRTKRPENMAAYDLVLQGLEYAKKGNVMKENTEKAVELFEKAIDVEPTYARAHAWRACSLSNLADWEDKPSPKLAEQAFNSINLALDLDPSNTEVHRIMGSIKLWRNRDYDSAEYHFEKAKELCPSDVFIISRYVNLLIYLGNFESLI